MVETISNIKEQLHQASMLELPELIKKYAEDERSGVQKIIEQYNKKISNYELELLRIQKMSKYEQEYKEYSAICGIDEVGRGPLAGPVVACAIILPKNSDILYLNDSKKLSERRREELYLEIMEKAITVGVGSIAPAIIDEINILQATYQAMQIAISNLETIPDILLNDAVTIPNIKIKQVPIIKGDEKSISIAAASIVAKVTRDKMMVEYDEIFPGYGFASNKGYGSTAHIEMLKKAGPTLIHRKSFIKKFI